MDIMTEELKKEIEEYEPKADDTVWTFSASKTMQTMQVRGPFTVITADRGICLCRPVDKLGFSFHTRAEYLAQSRGKAAILAGKFYKKQLLTAVRDLARMEYEVDKFYASEGID